MLIREMGYLAAKAALRRKKVHERSLEQTSAQIIQIEQQIYSIEAANINQETLNAMKNAGTAMKQIHKGLTIEKVDQTMYVPCQPFPVPALVPVLIWLRDDLREQHALSEEIVNAITNAPIGEPLDETELEAELEGMEQEAIDERMLKTGTVPVGDRLGALPAAANGDCKSLTSLKLLVRFNAWCLTNSFSERQIESGGRRRRRRGRTREIKGRDGHVMSFE